MERKAHRHSVATGTWTEAQLDDLARQRWLPAQTVRLLVNTIRHLRKRTHEIQEEYSKKYAHHDAEIAYWQDLLKRANEEYKDRSVYPMRYGSWDTTKIALLMDDRARAMRQYADLWYGVKDAESALYPINGAHMEDPKIAECYRRMRDVLSWHFPPEIVPNNLSSNEDRIEIREHGNIDPPPEEAIEAAP